MSGTHSDDGQRTLTTSKVVFLVLAAVAPMAAAVGIVPLSFAYGGAATTAMYLLAGIVLMCFSVGYAEMGNTLPSVGTLYSFIRHGLGAVPAAGGAVLALFGYTAIVVGAFGTAVYYFQVVVASETGITVAWGWWLIVLTAAVGALASRQVDVSAWVSSILVTAGFAVVIALDIVILAKSGLSAFTLDVFTPAVVLNSAPGVAVMYGFLCFIGFEAAALYSREAKNPNKTIPRSMLISVALIASFFVISSWLVTGAVGSANVSARAFEGDGGSIFLSLSQIYGGPILFHSMSILLLASLFATCLGMTNFAARYLQNLSSDRFMPAAFSTLAANGSPVRAVLAQITLVLVGVGGLGLLGADPYLDTGAVLFGVGAFSVVLLQFVAAVAITRYLYTRPGGGPRGAWSHRIAPVLSLAGLLGALILIMGSFSTVTGKSGAVFDVLPWLSILALMGGAARGYQLKRRHLEVSADPFTGER